MSNKNEIFEYLIDQLRQQVNKKDVTSFNVSVQISDLDEVKQVIHNLQQHIAGRGDEIRVLKDTLRQQVNNNQCEDLAHKVQSLKNQLRDASAQIKELHLALVKATGDAEAYKLIRKGGYISGGQSYVVGEHGPEQSGCCKEDTQGCKHDWFRHLDKDYCFKCGVTKSEECDHNWIIAPGLFIAEGHEDNVPGSRFCCECGAREWDDKEYKPKNDTQKCKHEWDYYYPNGEEHRRCTKCGVIVE